ncbi:homogentisate 1,2-dioxygenase [Sphingomonas abietis]|uniref:Homogentisate 1,2-dioxygenase n=1 Tax=Sphingomonas abietis TaxID=3012344 RepID=A0ABY7NLY5_9SPHN|nr:homogentisate 1,2-dioxygenase [Sphingomonas abietis]WBO22368.1 homogentisate 1,2-dioxygenase [Sphingomonas abietis]
MRVIGAMAATMLAIGMALPAIAQTMPERCALPHELAGWSQRHAVAAAGHFGGNPVPLLSVGEAVDLALVPLDRLAPVVPLGKAPGPDDKGGLVTFRAALSGTYRIALGGHGWIDVAKGQTPLASIAHSPGPQCAGIAKTVDFQLAAGTYILQISAVEGDSIPVMIARLP